MRKTSALGLAAAGLMVMLSAGCGSSGDGALFSGGGASAGSGGSGGTTGSNGCTKAPDCTKCTGCFDACVCGGASADQCLNQCASAGTGGFAGATAGTGGTGAGGSGFGGTGAGGTGGSGFGGSGGTGAGGTGGGQACTSDQQCAPGGGGFVPGCCDSNGACGYNLQGVCAPKNQPGALDPNCPPANFQGVTLQGCCNATHICGFMDTFLGLGCVDPTAFGAPTQGC